MKPNDNPRIPDYARRVYFGLDLGQTADHTALAIIRRVPPPNWNPRHDYGARPLNCIYEVGGLKRFRLGTAYPAIVDRVRELMAHADFDDYQKRLVVDATGVGLPIVDLLNAAGMHPIAVTITGGLTAREAEPRLHAPGGQYSHWTVPKRELVATLQALLQTERLRIATALPEAPTLLKELRGFRVRITDTLLETFGIWREREHDDTVLAVALACWASENVRERVLAFTCIPGPLSRRWSNIDLDD